MIIIMAPQATDADLDELLTNLKERGYGVHLSKGIEKTIVGVIGAHDDVKAMIAEQLSSLDYIERVVPILKPYKVVSREFHPDKTIIRVRGVDIGGQKVVVMAGPCSVESEEQAMESRMPPRPRALPSCGAGRSNRAPRRTASTAWVKTHSKCLPPPAKPPGCP